MAVVEGVDVDLDSVVKEAVDEEGAVGVGATALRTGSGQVVLQARAVIDDLHTAPAQHVAGTHEDGVADALSHSQRLVVTARRAMSRGGQSGLLQDHAEDLTVLRGVDRLGARAQDRHAGSLEPGRQAQRSLPAQLDDHAGHRAGCLLRLVNLHDVLEGQRLEVQAVRDVVVGRDGLRVAVDHDGLVPLSQGHRRVDAGVVELDPLTNAVGARSQDDDRLTLARGHLGLHVVGGVVVGRARGELSGAGVHGLVDRAQAEGPANLAHRVLADAPQGCDLGVGEAVALGSGQDLAGQGRRLLDGLSHLLQKHHLVQEPRVDLRDLEELV